MFYHFDFFCLLIAYICLQRKANQVRVYGNGWDYFDYHHTADDTLDKIDKADIAQNVAAYAAFVWMAANIDGHFRKD